MPGKAINGRRNRLRQSSIWAAALALFVAVLTPSVAAAQATGQVAGLNAHLMWASVSSAEQDRQLKLIADAGGKVVRVDVGWSSLESNEKGRYERWYLDRLDALVDKAAQHGVKLLFTVTDSPCWASSAPSTLKQNCEGSWWDRDVQRYPPVNAGDYADALAFLVRRYGNRVAAWEIWNEPNLEIFFRSTNPAPDYAKIVRAAYPAAKAADPASTILAGALAEAPATFVEELFRHGIGGHFDAFSIHPYSGDASPHDPLTDDWIKNSFARGVPSVREVLLRHGEDKPIWLTEFGWSTSTIRGEAAWRNGVDEETQARYTEQALTKVRDWPYVPVAIIYELQDESSDRSVRDENFGLFRHDGTPKPAYAAFGRGADALAAGTTADAPPAQDAESVEGVRAAADEDAGPDKVTSSSLKRVRLRIARSGKRIYARGAAAPRTKTRLRAYRYLRRYKRFSRRSAYKVRVRVGRSGRFVRRLNRRLKQGRWRVTASYHRIPHPRQARARVTLRRGRSI